MQDIQAAMRDHWEGTKHDPYTRRNPDEPWRPIALLRTSMGHGGDVAGVGTWLRNLACTISLAEHANMALKQTYSRGFALSLSDHKYPRRPST
jgi:hypothetical protein